LKTNFFFGSICFGEKKKKGKPKFLGKIPIHIMEGHLLSRRLPLSKKIKYRMNEITREELRDSIDQLKLC